MKKYVLGLSMIVSLSSFAAKDCTLNVGYEVSGKLEAELSKKYDLVAGKDASFSLHAELQCKGSTCVSNMVIFDTESRSVYESKAVEVRGGFLSSLVNIPKSALVVNAKHLKGCK